MTCPNHKNRAFTLVEIMVSVLVMAIVIGSAFAVYMSIAHLRMFTKNELEAYYNAQSWLDKVRTGYGGIGRYHDMVDAEAKDLNAADSVCQEDYNAWAMALRPKVQMTNTGYTISDTDLGSGVEFKAITVEVKWNELS
ncbi:MAG: prepilin-type N-terminal cleavage/methylation domain-containing protein [Candidatus Omnitrophica bacterium]|jgi:prepilin-type N-terminal cleavage/methylation domain-containing protein|nr:prepilin-type N-terminal cleavage/methylation domain-containing protein [Candidatus Omnitrophota bacterium]